MLIKLSDANKQVVNDKLTTLQEITFPNDDPVDFNKGWWWLVYNGIDPIAFAGLQPVLSWMKTGYLARCGVVDEYRGKHLQRKLIKKREDYAKTLGMERLITTTLNNPISANNLIARGFKTYTPERGWGAPDTIYWLKELS